MKLREVTKGLIIIGSIGILAACSSGRKLQGDQYALNHGGNANAAYSQEGAEASGVGGYKRFNSGNKQSHQQSHDQAKNVIAKRTYYFDFDSNIVRSGDKPAIAANADKIRRKATKVMLQGHTDPRGSREYNIGLGERRAKAVADLLRADGVNPRKIRLVSYGAEKLASPGHTEEDYQLDRRVVLVYVK